MARSGPPSNSFYSWTNTQRLVSDARPRCDGTLTLPVGNRPVQSEVGLRTTRHRLGNLRDQLELFHVQLHTQSRTLVRIQLTVLEVETHRQVPHRPALEIVLHHPPTG